MRSLVQEALGLPCCYCGVTLTDANFGIDHARPTSLGGSLGHDDEEFSALLRDWPGGARTDVLLRLRAGGKGRGHYPGDGRTPTPYHVPTMAPLSAVR